MRKKTARRKKGGFLDNNELPKIEKRIKQIIYVDGLYNDGWNEVEGYDIPLKKYENIIKENKNYEKLISDLKISREPDAEVDFLLTNKDIINKLHEDLKLIIVDIYFETKERRLKEENRRKQAEVDKELEPYRIAKAKREKEEAKAKAEEEEKLKEEAKKWLKENRLPDEALKYPGKTWKNGIYIPWEMYYKINGIKPIENNTNDPKGHQMYVLHGGKKLRKTRRNKLKRQTRRRR